jgi:glyceraldehyde 3-phosphate dehydrogenase
MLESYKQIDEHTLKVNGQIIKLFNEKDPANLKWGDSGADFVCESTGAFLS